MDVVCKGGWYRNTWTHGPGQVSKHLHHAVLYLRLCARNPSRPGVTCSIHIGPFQTMMTIILNIPGLDIDYSDSYIITHTARYQ